MNVSEIPTYLGKIGSVSGATVHIELAETIASGLAIIEGKTYKVGQVGSFIRIPQGYQNLYAIVTDIGADATPEKLKETTTSHQNKWIKAQLVGESVGQSFERGISQYPNVGDVAHLVAESDLKVIYSTQQDGHIPVGHLSNAESIKAQVNINKLLTRHSAVLGSTGSGKSTTVASLVRTIVNNDYPSARILLLDVHGEYAAALKDVAKIYSAEQIEGIETHDLAIPYWALNSNILVKTLFGGLSDNHLTPVLDKLTDYKLASLEANSFHGASEETMTVDSPIPFSIKQLWFDLIDNEEKTFNDMAQTDPALDEEGDAENVLSPKYLAPGAGSSAPFLNRRALGIKRQLFHCRSRLKDHRYDFLLHPGDWEPDLAGNVTKDMDDLLEEWIGHDKQVTILDFSAVPSEVLNDLIGSVLNILYEALYWGRTINAGGRERPLLVIMEEAHKYLDHESNNLALEMTKKIAKEGRKYGVGCMVVSQRPSEINETILSQCGTFFALRLSNSNDRARVKGTLPDGLGGLLDMLPSLRTGEAIITGEAANLPIRCRVYMPDEQNRPNSFDPEIHEKWTQDRQAENYNVLVARWRAQNTNFIIQDPANTEEGEDGQHAAGGIQ